jgi:predicted lipoprotein with Yx(FWY)xxD motif
MAALDMGKEASSEGLKAADVVKAAGGKDFLKRLDGEIKWGSDMKPGNTWTPAKKS